MIPPDSSAAAAVLVPDLLRPRSVHPSVAPEHFAESPVKLRVLSNEQEGCPLWGRRGAMPVPSISPPEPCPLTDRFDVNSATVEAVSDLGYHVQFRALDTLSGPAWSKKAGVIRLFYRPGHRMADLGKLFGMVRAHFGIGYTVGVAWLAWLSGLATAALYHF